LGEIQRFLSRFSSLNLIPCIRWLASGVALSGHDLVFLSSCTALRNLDLQLSPLEPTCDFGLQHLSALNQLTSLDLTLLTAYTLTSGVLDPLSMLNSLRSFSLRTFSAAPSVFFSFFPSLSLLESISLHGSFLSLDQLNIHSLTSLRSLSLNRSHPDLSDVALATAYFPHLTSLSVLRSDLSSAPNPPLSLLPSDFSLLASLTGLRELSLQIPSSFHLTSVMSLASLPSLSTLLLHIDAVASSRHEVKWHDLLTHLTGLDTLKIRVPYLHPEIWNRIVNMPQLQGLEIESYCMKHWDPSSVSSLPRLRHLRLAGKIDFHQLRTLDRLASLSLANHPFATYTSSDLRALADLTNLERLDLENVHYISWRDWDALLPLTRLACLRLPGRRKVGCVEELQLLISMLKEAEVKFPQKRKYSERENWVYLNAPTAADSHAIL
jgi:hypothetical protein